MRELFMESLDTTEGEGNERISINYEDTGMMKDLVHQFISFAKALSYTDGTIDKFIVNPYEYPHGSEELYKINQ